MPVKYGKMMNPWTIQVQMPNDESGDCGQWKQGSDVNKILYKYELKNIPKSINVFERDPQRGFQI